MLFSNTACFLICAESISVVVVHVCSHIQPVVIYMYGYICVHANIRHCMLYNAMHIGRVTCSIYSNCYKNTLALHTKVNVYHMRVSFSVFPNCYSPYVCIHYTTYCM